MPTTPVAFVSRRGDIKTNIVVVDFVTVTDSGCVHIPISCCSSCAFAMHLLEEVPSYLPFPRNLYDFSNQICSAYFCTPYSLNPYTFGCPLRLNIILSPDDNEPYFVPLQLECPMRH